MTVENKPKREHETVGRLFRAHGGVYRCTRYIRRSGFDMQCIERGMWDALDVPPRLTNVSEAAIGRTFHLIWDDASYVEHTQPCNCYVCED